MHLCRLTSAEQRLREASLAEIMTALGDVSIKDEEIIREKYIVSHVSHPSMYKQILCRLRRNAPFHWMILRHHPEIDRLSGLFFFDKKPFPEQMTSSILDSYELFSP